LQIRPIRAPMASCHVRGHSVLSARQIGLGDLQIEHGLAFGLILGINDLLRFLAVGGLLAGAFASGFVNAIEDPAALATAGQTVSTRHFVHATASLFEAGPVTLASSGRVKPGYAEY
jgi:hypothetical protein